MEKKASAASLKEAFRSHLEQTNIHVERLEEIGETLGIRVSGKKCKAMEGLIEEGKEAAQEGGDQNVLDVSLIAAAQRVEHYEISAYGSARTIAEYLGHEGAVGLLQQTLDEESATNKKLTELCQLEILPAAPRGAQGEEGEQAGEKAQAGRRTKAAHR